MKYTDIQKKKKKTTISNQGSAHIHTPQVCSKHHKSISAKLLLVVKLIKSPMFDNFFNKYSFLIVHKVIAMKNLFELNLF